jgi:predicted DNA-binding WGR domain protein
MEKLKVLREHEVSAKIQESIKRWTLNFTDITGNSNKFYNLEVVKTDKGVYLYTVYGRVGNDGVREYRQCKNQSHAEHQAEKLIKSKIKKGYNEIKLIKTDVGSEVSKTKVEKDVVSTATLDKLKIKFSEIETQSKLHKEVQGLVRGWFGDTALFVQRNLDTAKCPLGQLSLHQIDIGRQALDEARVIANKNKPDLAELNRLTSLYYTNIPHVLGHRINADELRFDNDLKINQAHDVLDVFADAKNIEKVLNNKSSVDAQYDTLNADIEFVEEGSPTFKWISAMFHETRAHNHKGLGKMRVNRVFKLTRRDDEKYFSEVANSIAKECGKHNPPEIMNKFSKTRPDISKEMLEVYNASNTFPVWHGTRKANMVGITTRGLLIRPSGVVHAGSMYGSAIYWAVNSSKSINYCDVKGSHWAKGNEKQGYLFLSDVSFGNAKIAKGSYYYTKQNIKPYHSVWAQGGNSGVVNDELMTYVQSGKGQQHRMRYVVEFETQVK